MSNRWFQILTILLDKGMLAILAAVLGFWLKKWQDDRVRTIERQFIPRTEIDLGCIFLGPQQNEFLVEISTRVKNKGSTRRKFKSMQFRLRGITAGEPLTFRQTGVGAVHFPHKFLDADLVPPGGNFYYYVEPGVEQTFTYITKIPSNVRFVLTHTKLISITEEQEHEFENEFTEERLFEVPSGNSGCPVVAP